MAELLRKLAAAGVPLRDICGVPLRGVMTGLKDAFLIDQRTRDTLVAHNSRCAEILKPALEGKDIRPWRIEWRRLWLIYTYHGINVAPYPAVLDYLSTFRRKLEQRATAAMHKWYELQQPRRAYGAAFESPKIVWPNLQNSPRYAYDARNYYIIAPACCLPTDNWVVLAILNSSIGWYWMQSTAIVRQSGWLEARPQVVANIPIPDISDSERRAISQLARYLSEDYCPNRLELEAELNDRVASLYRLTPAERRIVEGLVLAEQATQREVEA